MMACQSNVGSLTFDHFSEDFAGQTETSGGSDCGPRAVCWTPLQYINDVIAVHWTYTEFRLLVQTAVHTAQRGRS